MDTKNDRSKRQRWRWGYQLGGVHRNEYSGKGNFSYISKIEFSGINISQVFCNKIDGVVISR